MSQEYSIFNSQIIKCKIPKQLYEDSFLIKDVHQFFELEEVIWGSSDCQQKNGRGLTTSGLELNHMLRLRNITPLIDNISQSILRYYFKKPEGKLKYLKMWMNKMYLGCSGTCHAHIPKDTQRDINGSTGVAIFYFDVPKNSSKLIFLKNDIGNICVTDEHKDISHYIEVETGDLILHPSDLPHAVSEHKNSKPRICFVFDFFLENTTPKIRYF